MRKIWYIALSSLMPPNSYRTGTVLFDCYEYERVQVRALDTYVYSIAHAWGTVRCRTVCIVDSAYSCCTRTVGESMPKILINTLHQIRPNNRSLLFEVRYCTLPHQYCSSNACCRLNYCVLFVSHITEIWGNPSPFFFSSRILNCRGFE